MDLSILRELYEHENRCATVYLEGRSPGEDSAEQLRLRWAALREQLAEAGAGDAVLEPLDKQLDAEVSGEQQANGRVLVATDAGVLLDAPWDAAQGAGDAAHWTVVPELGPYARELATAVRLLVVICAAQGATVRREVVAPQHEPRELSTVDVQGDDTDLHKPRGGALSHNQIQRRVEETVQQNAKQVADTVRKAASEFRPEVVVLAGEVQARTAVREELTDGVQDLVTETDRGSDQDEALTEELLRIAERAATERSEQYTERLGAGQPRGEAVQGDQQVAKAAELGAVDTLLYEPGVPASREAFLLKVCAGTSSGFGLVPAGTGLDDGVGALLRYAAAS